MKKILIFEDEWNSIRGSFELANILSFSEQLEFEVRNKSQAVSFDSYLKDRYSAIFIDHTLSKKTVLDGIHIYQLIKQNNLFDMSKVFILTGNTNFKSYCRDLDCIIPDNSIIFKPANYNDIGKKLKECLN